MFVFIFNFTVNLKAISSSKRIFTNNFKAANARNQDLKKNKTFADILKETFHAEFNLIKT